MPRVSSPTPRASCGALQAAAPTAAANARVRAAERQRHHTSGAQHAATELTLGNAGGEPVVRSQHRQQHHQAGAHQEPLVDNRHRERVHRQPLQPREQRPPPRHRSQQPESADHQRQREANHLLGPLRRPPAAPHRLRRRHPPRPAVAVARHRLPLPDAAGGSVVTHRSALLAANLVAQPQTAGAGDGPRRLHQLVAVGALDQLDAAHPRLIVHQ